MKKLPAILIALALCACDVPPPDSTRISNGTHTITVSIIEKDGHKFAVVSTDHGAVSICEVSPR